MPEATDYAPYSSAAHRALGRFYIRAMCTKYGTDFTDTKLLLNLRKLRPNFTGAQCQAELHRAFNVLQGDDPDHGIT